MSFWVYFFVWRSKKYNSFLWFQSIAEKYLDHVHTFKILSFNFLVCDLVSYFLFLDWENVYRMFTEISRSNPLSYLCWNMHVGKQSAAMLAAKRSAGVAPDVNLREHISCAPLPTANKAAHSGFETQRRCHQNSKWGVQWPHKKNLCPPIIFKKICTEHCGKSQRKLHTKHCLQFNNQQIHFCEAVTAVLIHWLYHYHFSIPPSKRLKRFHQAWKFLSVANDISGRI